MDENENPLLQYDDYPATSGFHIVSGTEDDEDDYDDYEEDFDQCRTFIRR